jgi:hypothetical protein
VPDRLFTPEEANAALEQVRPLVERLVERRAALLAAQARLAELLATVAGNGGGLDPARARSLVEGVSAAEQQLNEVGVELADAGVVVRDPDSGLIDFPSVRSGELVFLCWQLGEDAVEWWHRPDEGFAGRKPLRQD